MNVGELRDLAAAGPLSATNRKAVAGLVERAGVNDLFAIAVIPSLDGGLKEDVRLAIVGKAEEIRKERMYFRLAALLYPDQFR